ncbi:MAG: polysaccharide pyruvyl transferase family protein [Ruminococcaceae bacterium]|nr:polysaccharide pyruvyl transferase family protein [Oscillospiraceae bacterium]
MKVGIVTFQETNNYGAILQNYGLQQAIRQLGAEPETIDYRSRYIGRPYGLAHLKNKGLGAYLFGVAGYLVYAPRAFKSKHFRRHMTYSPKVKREDLAALNDRYDRFITGSDQVFNHKLTGMDGTYMLDFVTDKSKCSSYAASLGLASLDPEAQEIYRKNLAGFRYVTVREQTAVPVLEEAIGREVTVVSDPSLLLTRDEWAQVAVEPTVKDRYVFVYELAMSKDVVALAQTIAKKEGLKIVFAPFPMGKLAAGRYDVLAGAGEILGYIKNAEYVVTDSFHGTVFSILFNKRFFTRVADEKIGSRIRDLLAKCGLEDRLIKAGQTDYEQPISYDAVNGILATYREESRAQLAKML